MTQTLAVIACLTSSLALAQTVPGSISFNARLTDTSGAPITGSHTLAFGLYTTGSGGAAVWTETISGAGFSTEGITFAELGASTPLTTAAIDGSKLYLEISVDGTTMSPRLAVVSVPYAIRASIAATSLTVGSLVESAIQRRVTGTCTPGQAVRSIDAAGGVQCENVAGGGGDITAVSTAVGSGLTGGSAAGDVALSLSTCPVGEYLRSTGTGWACGRDGVSVGGGLALTATNYGLIACTGGEVLKHTGTAWACAVDNAGNFTAGAGLALSGSAFSVNFAGSGSATTVARSDHTHASTAMFAQFEGNAQTFAANAWTGIIWSGAPNAQGITRNGANITFTQAGTYRVTVMSRVLGADVWTAFRMFGDFSSRGHSAGFGSGSTSESTQPTTADFLFTIANITTPYQLQVGRLTGTLAGTDPSIIAGEQTPFIVATIQKID